ncbi:MAG: hypothetical protein U5K51_03970 [Flavobacteriaceae bacterium]|nr:hypothetical protein [Flavobacteriaceae bacterium]
MGDTIARTKKRRKTWWIVLLKWDNRYKQYGADKMANQVLKTGLGLKQASDAPNKNQLIKIVEEGLAKIK